MVPQSGAARSDEHLALAAVSHLVTVADGDTLYRDAYLRRAAEILSPVISERQRDAVIANRAEIARLRAQARLAIAQQEWDRLRDLGTRAATLQRMVLDLQGSLPLAEALYRAPAVALDPFSPGLLPFCGRWSQAAQARDEVCASLTALGREDVEMGALYAARKTALGALGLPTVDHGVAGSSAAAGSDVDVEQQVLQAIERGDVSALEHLVASISGKRPSLGSAGADGPTVSTRRITVPPSLGEPIPASAVSRGSALGLEYVEASGVEPSLAAAVSDFLERYAIGASPVAFERASDGVAQITLATEGVGLLPEAAESFARTLSLLALHLTINSAGLRYVPLSPHEPVLVERHAEGDEAVTPLLRSLGLDRRRALARDEIETALLKHGARVLGDDLGLDPLVFRLVCIPADLYARIGRERDWGRREEWTHFDGYQVLAGGRLRALVGGNARFGGLFDVCSIARDDGRENTLVRFAVVRRERLGVRLA